MKPTDYYIALATQMFVEFAGLSEGINFRDFAPVPVKDRPREKSKILSHYLVKVKKDGFSPMDYFDYCRKTDRANVDFYAANEPKQEEKDGYQ